MGMAAPSDGFLAFFIYTCAISEQLFFKVQRHFEIIVSSLWCVLVQDTARHCYSDTRQVHRNMPLVQSTCEFYEFTNTNRTPRSQPNVSETFNLREVLIINKSLTSRRFQLHGDVQPLTSPWKAAIIASTEPSGELGKNATVQATATAKLTPQAQPRYPPRQPNTPRGLGFHT